MDAGSTKLGTLELALPGSSKHAKRGGRERVGVWQKAPNARRAAGRKGGGGVVCFIPSQGQFPRCGHRKVEYLRARDRAGDLVACKPPSAMRRHKQKALLDGRKAEFEWFHQQSQPPFQRGDRQPEDKACDIAGKAVLLV